MDLEDLRLAVYGWFARTGRSLTLADLAGRLALGVSTVRAGLIELAQPGTSFRSRPTRSSWRTRFRRAARLRGHGPTDTVVGRLRLGLLRAAAPAPGRGRGAGVP